MRISTKSMYETGIARISDLQGGLSKMHQQLATGRRILTPSDDPVASARVYDVSQSKAANTQYATNRENVKFALQREEGVLQSVTQLLQDVKVMIVAAGNAAYSDAERRDMGGELQSRLEEMMSLANSDDGMGGYLFAGYKTATQPFSRSGGAVVYGGDQGERMLQVGLSRTMAFADHGAAVFNQARTGNGSFATAAAASNAGTGVISGGSVTDSSQLAGHDYRIAFTVNAGVTTYDVIDDTTGLPVSTGNAYASGDAIEFDGMRFDISGAPADGDSFSVVPSTAQSMFTSMQNLIDTLMTPGSGPASSARLNNGLMVAHANFDNALDHILSVRASVGSRLKELDALDNNGATADLQYSQHLSELQDLDYAKAISSLMQQQTTLDAAQQSFVKISGMSLFNYL